jgi:hypothetical protein
MVQQDDVNRLLVQNLQGFANGGAVAHCQITVGSQGRSHTLAEQSMIIDE